VIDPNQISGEDRIILLEFQSAKVRLEAAEIYFVEEPAMYQAYFAALEHLSSFENTELRALAREACLVVDGNIPPKELELRKYKAEQELIAISLMVEDLFPLASKATH
jgi:hypothetical protein